MLLTIFYDGYCPICVSEMDELKHLDKKDHLQFENIYKPDFSERYPELDIKKADAIIHGMTFQGEMLYGLDVICRAWQLVNKKPWLQALRWPGVKWFADCGYLFFARHRYKISYWLTGEQRCERCIR